jgi:hypothetical protein
MDMADELSGTFRVPKALIALLAIIVGILILFFPYILNVLVAFFLVVWGLLKAAELGSKPARSDRASSTSLES